jgi:hypothetical protein
MNKFFNDYKFCLFISNYFFWVFCVFIHFKKAVLFCLVDSRSIIERKIIEIFEKVKKIEISPFSDDFSIFFCFFPNYYLFLLNIGLR